MAFNRNRAFTLIEVVIALGIFAAGIITVLALMGPLNRAGGEVGATVRAAGLGGAIQTELEHLRDSHTFTGGASRLDQLQAVLAGNEAPRLIVARDGSALVLESDQTNDPAASSHPGMAEADRYFLVELQLPPALINGLPNPLSHRAGAGFLAIQARIAWPYQTARQHPEQASQVILNLALTP
jgi:hypothetical protein